MESFKKDILMNSFPETADIETSSEDYARRFSGDVGKYFLDVQAKITLELIQSWPGTTVLDVGGGHAQLAVPLVKAGYKVTVIGSHESCRQRLDMLLPAQTFDFKVGNLIDLPFSNNSFDIVIAFRLLPHVEHWKELIAELSRVARRAVVIDYPDIRSFNIFYKIFFSVKKAFEGNTRPFRCFSRKEVIEEFRKHNLHDPILRPQFFIPMVLHRSLKIVFILKFFESVARYSGLTYLFGSPVILRMTK